MIAASTTSGESMRLGFFSWFGYELPYQEGLDLIRDVAKQAEAVKVVIAFENTRKPEVIDYVLSESDTGSGLDL